MVVAEPNLSKSPLKDVFWQLAQDALLGMIIGRKTIIKGDSMLFIVKIRATNGVSSGFLRLEWVPPSFSSPFLLQSKFDW